MKTARRHPLAGLLMTMSLMSAAPAALAGITEVGDLTAPCGDGKPVKGTKELYRGTDSKGNKFILNCVDNVYYEGKWIHDGKEEVLGRCTFDQGLNDQSFYLDEKGDYSRIVWWNVEPKGIELADIREKEGETAEKYIERIKKLVKDKGAKSNLYDTSALKGPKEESDDASIQQLAIDDLWTDQTISSFIDGILSDFVILTPDETFSAYSEGGLSFLQIDPAMLEAPHDPQENDGMIHRAVAEPSSLALLGLGILIVFHRRRRR